MTARPTTCPATHDGHTCSREVHNGGCIIPGPDLLVLRDSDGREYAMGWVG